VAEYVDGHPAMAVLAADGVEAQPAAEALAEALRRGGRARQVLGDAAPGLVHPGDPDIAIVRRAAAALPVETVVVVRGYTVGGDAGAAAAFYDRNGRLSASLAALRGSPVAARAVEDEYERRFIGFQAVSFRRAAAGSAPNGRWGTPYLGRDQRRLEPFELFNVVDRPDLAERYMKRSKTRRALLATGGVVAVVGLG